MITLANEDILKNTNFYKKAYDSVTNIPFTEEMFLRKALPRLSAQTGKTYPYQVKIPPSLDDMMQGNFNPSKVITIDKPFDGPYGEMWFGDSTDGIRLLAGYRNGDSRYICDYALGDANVHGILVGSTGQGKSVTLNSMIYGACYVYAPWELDLVLCDAKIVEFKKIAVNYPMPQITAIAATGDADYLISVLDAKLQEMTKRSAMFPIATAHFGKDIAKIGDFRKITGMAMPQIIIIVDEFQTMFKNAGKKRDKLLSIIDGFARLGRATGVHFLMASQEVGSDLPATLMTNVKLRMAMGCYSSVSEKVLGNKGAALNMGKKGHMLLNDNIEAEGGEANNILFRIPFPPDQQIHTMTKSIIALGKELDVAPVLSFYDEDAKVFENQYSSFLKRFNLAQNKIYLGEPSFMTKDPEQCVRITFTGKELETVGVLVNNDYNLIRHLTMLIKNIELVGGQNLALCAHPVVEDELKISEFVTKKRYYDKPQYDNNSFFVIMRELVFKRILIVQADKDLMEQKRARSPETDEYFDAVIGKGSKHDTITNRERLGNCIAVLSQDQLILTGFRLLNPSKSDEDRMKRNILISCIEMCTAYGYADKLITGRTMPVINFFIIGLDSIVGLGRSSKPKWIQELCLVMHNCSTVNVRIFTFTTTYMDLNEVAAATRFFIIEGVASNELSKIKCDCYPNIVGAGLSVLYDTQQKADGCFKFKKMIRMGEIVS